MRRREFIAGLGAGGLSTMAPAQQASVLTVGLLYAGTREEASFLPGFRKGLSEMGFIEGRNVAIEYRFADDHYDRVPALVADLVRRRVAVIYVTGGDGPVAATKAATTTIPIVFLTGGDPVDAGHVASLNRPGANVTGISFINAALVGKRIDLLHGLVPAASRFALLMNPNEPFRLAEDSQAASTTIAKQLEVFTATTNDEIEAAFTRIVQWRAEALVVGSSPLFAGRGTRQLAALALRNAIPAMHYYRGYIEAGGLASYGSSFADTGRLSGIYVGRILKGEKPAELPVMQPTRFEFVLNLTAAKVIGLDIPPTMLAIADEVIE